MSDLYVKGCRVRYYLRGYEHSGYHEGEVLDTRVENGKLEVLVPWGANTVWVEPLEIL